MNINEQKLREIIRKMITEETQLYATFGSHRAREKAERMVTLPKPLYNFRHAAQFYPVSPEDAEQLNKSITGTKIVSKLPGDPDSWNKTWD